MKELQERLNRLKNLEYSTIALDISNLDKEDLKELKGTEIYEETNYLIFIAEKGIDQSHQAENLNDEPCIDYIIKI